MAEVLGAAVAGGIAALRAKVEQLERELGGAQVTWASTPKEAAVLRAGGVLHSCVVGSRRQYAFANEWDREQFVYARHDTLFTVSRDIRQLLGLSPPVFRGTTVSAAAARAAAPAAAAPAPKRGRSNSAAKVRAPAPAATPAPAPAAPPQPARTNRFRK